MYEQMTNIVRKKGEGGRREASLFRCKESIRTQYVLNQRRGVEESGRWERRKGEGEDGVKGRKDRMKKGRGGEIRLGQSEQV